MKNKKEIIESLGIKSSTTKAFVGFSLAISVLLIVYVAGIFMLTGKNSLSGQTSNIFYWTGAGADGNWSSALNWNQNRVPGKDAVVIFDASAKQNKESVVDEGFRGEISSLKIENYGSKIVQNDDLVISGDYYQSSGEYEAVGSLDVAGDFIQKDGSVFSFGNAGLKVYGLFDVSDNDFKIKDDGFALINYNGQPRRYSTSEYSGDGYKANNVMESGQQLPEGVLHFSNDFNVFESKISETGGWELVPYGGGWSWRYLFGGLVRGGQSIVSQNLGLEVKDNGVYMNRGNGIQEYYKNSYQGIEQVFVLNNKIDGNGKLILSGQISMQDLSIRENSKDSISFITTENYLAFNLDHLKIYDAKNKEFKAEMNLVKQKDGDNYDLEIIVDDTGAEYPLTVDPLSSTADWSAGLKTYVSGKSAPVDSYDTWFGKTVHGAGDINGDGYDDVLVGAYENGGGIYAYYGSVSGLSGGASSAIGNYQWSKVPGVDHMSYNMSSAGNVNGDHHATLDSDGDGIKNDFDDVIVGDSNFQDGDGRASLFSGSVAGLSATASWNVLGDGVEAFGYAVADVGDINNDGYDDVMVGAPLHAYNSVNDRGRAYLYLGSSSGLSINASWTMRGNASGDYFGTSITGLGDINEDGCSDVAVGAPGYGTNGRVYVYYGCGTGCSCVSGGLSPVFSSSPTPAIQTFDSPGRQLFGVSLASGDFNKDGLKDLVVGASDGSAPDASGGDGAVYVYYGINTGTGLSSSVGWSYTNATVPGLGYSVANAGDINGDSCSDLLVGSWKFSLTYSEGKAFVFYGCNASAGNKLPSTPDWTKSGSFEGQRFGFNVSSAGDVDRDGDSEILIGSYHYGYSKAFMFEGFGACSPLNNKPVAAISGFATDDLCQGLNYTLNWNFTDVDADLQSAYDIEVREKNTTSPVLSDHKNLSEKFYKILNGAVGTGNIVYGKNYEWRVKVYDDDARPLCGGVSNWSNWSDVNTQGFVTPVNQYPDVDFDAIGDSKDCLTENCDFLKEISFNDKSKTYSTNPLNTYAWYIDNMATVFSANQNIAYTFLEAKGTTHNIRLKVTDGSGYSCWKDDSISFNQDKPSWTEVTPR
jgi:hypothetical protein